MFVLDKKKNFLIVKEERENHSNSFFFLLNIYHSSLWVVMVIRCYFYPHRFLQEFPNSVQWLNLSGSKSDMACITLTTAEHVNLSEAPKKRQFVKKILPKIFQQQSNG